MFNNKNVLVTGGTGMIGRYLVKMLLDRGSYVRVVSLDSPDLSIEGAQFIQTDLTYKDNCRDICKDMDIVFHLAGIKGSPKAAMERPATFFVPLIQLNTNMMDAAFKEGVQYYLFTSTVGVYHPAPVLLEDDVWKTFPSENDKYAGWAKRMGELQADAYRIEYGWDKVCIVRPANVYGRYDNFDSENAMVIPSLINRVHSGENPLIVWGDGSPIRDFIHAEDVASGMIHLLENGAYKAVNLASGTGVSIKELVEIIIEASGKDIDVVWDTTKPMGDPIRLMSIERAKSYGWSPKISLRDGIRDVFAWLEEYDPSVLRSKRHSVFK